MTARMVINVRTLARAVLPTVLVLAAFQGCRITTYEVDVTSVTVTPADSSIAVGTTAQFTAVARFSDDSERNVTDEATWTSSDSAVATVSSAGVATPAQAGTSTITASLQGRSGAATLTVTNALLESIEVTPANPSIANGTRQQFTAIGHFDDASTQDITASATWTSSDGSVEIGAGLARSTALGQATSTITAAVGAISGSTVLTVNAVTLTSLSVTPATATIKVGNSQQFEATGSFSDASTQSMTGEVTWSSSASAVATVSSAGGATGVFAGTATITATSSALLGSASDTAQLTVESGGGGYN